MHFHYSTEGMAQRRKTAYWNEAIATEFIPAQGGYGEPDTFEARLLGHRLGNISVGQSSAKRHTFARSERQVREDARDDFVLLFAETGKLELSQLNRHIALESGEFTLSSSAYPFLNSLDMQSLLLLRIPRTTLLSRFPRAESLLNIKFGRDFAIAGLLGSMLKTGLRMDVDTPAEAKTHFANAIVETLVTAMALRLPDSELADESRRERLYRRAISHIDLHLDDPHLDVDGVAAATHVSRRTLLRVFSAKGTTTMQEVWSRRLHASHLALSQKRVTHVTQAAYQCGFTDLSHFCRLFKKRFGQSPGDVLRAAV